MINLVYIFLSFLFVLMCLLILRKMSNKKKIVEQKQKNQANFEVIQKKYEEIKNELERCKKISKNPQTQELILNWDKEYLVLDEGLNEILELQADLEQLELKTKSGKYIKRSKILNSTIDYFLKFAQEYYTKLKNFTSFELDNTQMAVDLKERLKTLNNVFDQQVKIYGFVSEWFIAKVANITVKINDFEKDQKDGDYPSARIHLKSGNDLLVELERNVKVIIDYYQELIEADEILKTINSEKLLLQKYKYFSYNQELDAVYTKYQKKKEYFKEKIEIIDLDNQELLATYVKELEFFMDNVKEYDQKLSNEAKEIKEIESIKNKNSEKIKLVEELIGGCKEEKEIIKKLYNINNISHFDKIEEQEQSFLKFKEDYEKLINIIIKEKENFIQYEENVLQTSKYLERVLVNLRTLIKNLAAIRSDEIAIRDKIYVYQKELVNVTLYLKEHHHFEIMSQNLVASYNEIKTKLEELALELEKEPLDIGLVRVLSDVIEKQLLQFGVEAQKDIKQRLGVEKLILFYNRFIINDEYAKYYNHFLNLYNDKEYRKILKEIHGILSTTNEKGEELYRSIVSTINLSSYKSMIQ
ncbi:MAG: septation ring formation regulator EzrA [Mycoplasmatales bacterium]